MGAMAAQIWQRGVLMSDWRMKFADSDQKEQVGVDESEVV